MSRRCRTGAAAILPPGHRAQSTKAGDWRGGGDSRPFAFWRLASKPPGEVGTHLWMRAACIETAGCHQKRRMTFPLGAPHCHRGQMPFMDSLRLGGGDGSVARNATVPQHARPSRELD